MSKSLMKPEKLDAKQRIEKMLAGEDILLSSEEEKILARWEFADKLLAAKELSWDEIRVSLVEQFGISRFTAENDIAHAQEVFGRAKRISKRYLLHLHIERLDRDIERMRKALFGTYTDEDGKVWPTTPDSKELAALAKLHDAYTEALNSIPEDNAKVTLPPPVLIFNLPAGVSLPNVMSFDDAMKAADEYIDFIETNNDGTENGSADQGHNDATASHDGEVDPGQ